MNDAAEKTSPTRKGRSLEDEIARQEAKLKRLQDSLKEKKRREQERNAKAIFSLLQAEHLDQVPAEIWQRHLPQLKALLGETAPPFALPDSGTTAKSKAEPARSEPQKMPAPAAKAAAGTG